MSEESKNTLSTLFPVKKAVPFAIAVVITAILWNLPLDAFGIDGLTVIQRRVIAVFAFGTIMWLTEAIAPWATSIGIIGLLLLCASDNAFNYFTEGIDKSELLSHEALMATFADPVIILFLGGFIIAIAATKTGLDAYLARTLIKPFGNKSERVLLGFILITGCFSMFVSNTATAAMMLTFLTPVFKALPPDGKGRVALTLSIPLAANIGGMGTIIGTPPNAIAIKYINDPAGMNLGMSFGDWVSFMMPYTVIMLLIGWLLLVKLYPFKQKTIKIEIAGEVKHDWRTVVVAVTFLVTVALWIFDRFTGVGTNTVAFVPILVFALTGIINAKDLQEINWSVIWMVAGGFALGLALNDSGLADNMIKSIPFGQLPPIVILIVAGLICYILSNFISNTATAALLMPILAVVCKGMGSSLDSIGGGVVVLMAIAISASLAMTLPVSTPPNAIAYSTGLVKQSEMAKMGIIIGVIGLVLGYGMLYVLGITHVI